MRHCATAAIVLKTRPLREADLLITCLTPAAGKLVGVAAHARRSQRRFGGALAPGTIAAMEYSEQAGSDLARIETMRGEWSPLGRGGALHFIATLGVVLEVAEATTVERQGSPEKFRLLGEALRRTPDGSVATTAQWLVRWLGLLGVAPELSRCVRCGRREEPSGIAKPPSGAAPSAGPNFGRGGPSKLGRGPGARNVCPVPLGRVSISCPPPTGGSPTPCPRFGTAPPEVLQRFVPHEGGLVCAACFREHGWSTPADASACRCWAELASGEGICDAATVRREGEALLREGLWHYVCQVAGRSLKSRPYWDWLWEAGTEVSSDSLAKMGLSTTC